MEPENSYTDIWSAFVSILSNDIVTSDGMDDILKKAQGILSQSDKIFIAQDNDSCDLIVEKRFWLRWLIRRLLAICVELKESLKVKKRACEILELIMRKASSEPSLIYHLTENFIILLDDLEKASLRLFDDDAHISIDPFDEVNLRSFGSEWKEPHFILNDNNDPYANQFKNIEISLKYGHEAEMLQEMVTDIISVSVANGVSTMEIGNDVIVSEIDKLVLGFADLNICLHHERIHQLWKIMIRQLNIADANLKRSSLDLITILLKEKCIPITSDMYEFVELLFLLIAHFMSKSTYVKEENSRNLKRKYSDTIEMDNMSFSEQCYEGSDRLIDSVVKCFETLISMKLAQTLSDSSLYMVLSIELNKMWGSIDRIKEISESSRKLQSLAWKGLMYLFESNNLLNPGDYPIEEIIERGASLMYKTNTRNTNENLDECKELSICVKAFAYMIRNDVLQSEAWERLKSSKEERLRLSQVKEKGSHVLRSEENLKLRDASQTWALLHDHVQQLIGDQRKSSECISAFLFLTTLMKNVLLQLDKRLNLTDVEFLKGSELSRFTERLFCIYRQMLSQKNKNECSFYIHKFSNLIKYMIIIQPRETFTQLILQQTIGYLTSPWMSGQTKFSDLRLSHDLMKNLANLGNHLRVLFPDTEEFVKTFINESLIHLIFGGYTKELAPNWRLVVAENIWVECLEVMKKNENNRETIKHIIRALPLLLHSYGTSALKIAKNIIEEVLNSQNVDLIEILSYVSGSIVCSLTKKTYVITIKEYEITQRVVCPYCSKEIDTSRNPDLALSRPIYLQSENENVIINLLAKLIGYHDKNVRVALFNLIIPMSNHVGFWETSAKSTANLWLLYLEEEENTCLQFANYIKYLAAPAWVVNQYERTCLHNSARSNNRPADQRAILEQIMAESNDVTLFNEREKIWKLIFISLKNLCDKAMNMVASNDRAQVTIVEAAVLGVVNVALLNIPYLEKHILRILLDLYFSSACHVSTFHHADKIIKDMLKNNRADACNRLAAQMCSSNSPRSNQSQFMVADAKNVMKLFIALFEGDGEFTSKRTADFLMQQLSHLLPPLVLESCRSVSCNNENVISPLQYVANEIQLNKKSMIAENLCHIFPHLVLHCKDNKELKKCMEFIEKETKTEFWGLVPSQRTLIINELVTKLSKGKDRIVSALEKVAKSDREGLKLYGVKGSLNNAKQTTQLVDLPKFLLTHLMGCLDYIDGKFNQHSSIAQGDIDYNIDLIKSLQHLIKIMGGTHIGGAKYTLLSTINTASSKLYRHKNGNTFIIDTWEVLIKTMDHDHLSAIVGQILANLTLMYQTRLDSDSPKLLGLFRYLVIQNQTNLSGSFNMLHFLPEYPEFSDFNNIIRKVNNINEDTEFKLVLAAITESTNNESIEAKALTLTKLLHVLKSNQGKVQGLILASDQADISITRLFNLLLGFSSIASPEEKNIASIAGQCIGSLGAVDPGRLQTICDLNCDSNIVDISVMDENFGVNLLTVLKDAYVAALSSENPDNAKKCAYSIQQTLRFCGIKEYIDNKKEKRISAISLGARIWERLKDSSREVLGQFFESMYERTYTKTTHTLPIFKSDIGATYENWLINWSLHLIGKITDNKTADIFIGAIPSINSDIRCAQFLLPYIVATVIIQSSNDAAEVRDEIEVIIDENTSELSRTPSEINSFLLREEWNEESTNKDISKKNNQMKYHVVQMVFAILDLLNKWLKKRYGQLTEKMRPRDDPVDYTSKDAQYVSIKQFVEKIKQKTLAKVSLESKAYARSLLHLESHLMKFPSDLQDCLPNLQKIYGALQEPDYVAGLKEIRRDDPTMFEMIHYHQAMGNFQDGLACCQSLSSSKNKMLSSFEKDVVLPRCILQSYLELDQPQLAFILAENYAQSKPQWRVEFQSLQLKAAKELSQWTDVESLCNKVNPVESWESSISSLLLKLQKGHYTGQSYDKLLAIGRQIQVNALRNASKGKGAYARCYENVIKLQILDEIESMSHHMKMLKQCTSEKKNSDLLQSFDNLYEEWKTRISFSRSSLSNIEEVLKVRKCLFGMAKGQIDSKLASLGSTDSLTSALNAIKTKINSEIAKNSIQIAKIARKESRLEKAYRNLLEAQEYNHPELFIEQSKLVWARNNQSEAIDILEKGILRQFPNFTFGFPRDLTTRMKEEDREICAKAKLLLARYVDEAASFESTIIIKYYEEARSMSKASEDANYASATFFDKIVGKNYEPSDLDTKGTVVRYIIQLYGNSLKFGCDHLAQSLPRMLSLWFDYGSRYEDNQKLCSTGDRQGVALKMKTLEEMGTHLKRINDLMQSMVNTCFNNTPFLLLAALPQLISRICHSNGNIWNILRVMLVRTFANYPQQVMWHMVPLLKSSYRVRSSRAQDILEQVKSKCPQHIKLIEDGLQLSDKLLKLCDEKSSGDKPGSVSLHQLMPSLIKLINNSNFSKIIMPSNVNMTMRLPTKEIGMSNHDAFSSGSYIFFEKVEENVTIMRSLVKPKKLDFRGSDGKKYSFLCKPKDDLRRDCRLLEFNNLLNKLFMKDPECRKRNLYIRTYTVIPLNETNGIIEWVNNVVPLRMILMKLYKEKLGKNMMRPQEINDYTCNPGETEKNKKNYDYLLKRHSPTVFGEWFINNFPDPQSWYMARLSYTRTTAVMSMVCYLIGLGDRHCENIMYDETNGDTLHVDLNCLFNKGAELRVPEIVPFRLTPNMVAAFGPTGYEGPFRLACEAAIGLMRKQKDVLMSSLRPFVYDPLVDWVPKGGEEYKKMRGGDKSKETGEIVNETAVVTLKNISNRLKGLIEEKKKTSDISSHHIPLSVAGQVQHLIKEAASYDNLSQMYHGWAPYL